MDTLSPAALAEEWIQKWSPAEPAAIEAGAFVALDWDLPREHPELCLTVIREVLERIDTTSPSRLLSLLAAGPLEDLLSHHGESVVGEVELLARRDPGFRLLLNGVWGGGIKPSILERLAKYRGNPW